MTAPFSAVLYCQQVLEYIGEKFGVNSEMASSATYDEIDVTLGKRAIGVAFMCSSPMSLIMK